MAPRILVADDEEGILEAVGYALRAEGFDVVEVRDGEAAVEAAQGDDFEVVVLDVMMPKLSGLDACRALRAAGDVPIIMLTARDAEIDKVLGLELGADDYVTKPFSMAELVSRIRALLRRRELDRDATKPATITVGDIRIDVVRHEVEVEGTPVRLTPSEFKILALLAEEPGRVFTRRQVMEHLWASPYVGDERATDVHVSSLRRKLERDPRRPERLVTVRGVGYKLVPA